MSKKTMVRGLLAGALATMVGGAAMGDAILPTLPPGSQYQIILVTSDGTTATSSNIADYDNFATQEADQSPTLAALGVTWTAVASTATSAANQATNTTTIPLYDTNADYEAPNFPGLWKLGVPAPDYTQTGAEFASGKNFRFVWTGSFPGGRTSFPLGTADPEAGMLDSSDWLYGQQFPASDIFSLYAISSPITVQAPEPATLTLLGSALLGLGVVYLRRRRAEA
jgi:hypothetical protein